MGYLVATLGLTYLAGLAYPATWHLGAWQLDVGGAALALALACRDLAHAEAGWRKTAILAPLCAALWALGNDTLLARQALAVGGAMLLDTVLYWVLYDVFWVPFPIAVGLSGLFAFAGALAVAAHVGTPDPVRLYFAQASAVPTAALCSLAIYWLVWAWRFVPDADELLDRLRLALRPRQATRH